MIFTDGASIVTIFSKQVCGVDFLNSVAKRPSCICYFRSFYVGSSTDIDCEIMEPSRWLDILLPFAAVHLPLQFMTYHIATNKKCSPMNTFYYRARFRQCKLTFPLNCCYWKGLATSIQLQQWLRWPCAFLVQQLASEEKEWVVGGAGTALIQTSSTRLLPESVMTSWGVRDLPIWKWRSVAINTRMVVFSSYLEIATGQVHGRSVDNSWL